jgi:subtilisin family serine protease
MMSRFKFKTIVKGGYLPFLNLITLILIFNIGIGSSLSFPLLPEGSQENHDIDETVITDENGFSVKNVEYYRILREADEDNNKIEDYLEQQIELMQKTDSNSELKVMVRLDTKVSQVHLDFLQDLGVEIKHSFHIINAISIRLHVNLLHEATELPDLEIIYADQELEPMLKSSLQAIETDQDSLGLAGYPWIDGSGVTIAILDSTGIDGNHSTFPPGKIIAFKDFRSGEEDLDPTDGMQTDYSGEHGTMTASCAVGTGGDTANKGAAPGANLIYVNLAGAETSSFNEGLEWCIDHKGFDFNKDGVEDGPDIISMSIGTHIIGLITREDFKDMSDAVREAGIIFVTSAGNEGPLPKTVSHPASFENVIAVGSVNDDKTISIFSSRGPGENGIIKPNICAPGEEITCAIPGGGWSEVDGTSFASPIVAGIIALILQLKPELSPDEVQSLLQENAEDGGLPGPDNTYGYGIVDTITVLQNISSNSAYQSYPPKASFTYSPGSPTIEDIIQFTDSSMNSDGEIVSWSWDFGDGTYSTEQNPSYQYTETGEYKVSLTVVDDNDMADTVSQNINVRPIPNIPPSVQLINPKNGEIVSGLIEIKGSSSDSDGDVKQVEIRIDWGAWMMAIGTTSWSFDWDTTAFEQGNCSISVRSYDGFDFSKIETIDVIVENNPSEPHVEEPEEPQEPEDPSGSEDNDPQGEEEEKPDDTSSKPEEIFRLDSMIWRVIIIAIMVVLIIIAGIISIKDKR